MRLCSACHYVRFYCFISVLYFILHYDSKKFRYNNDIFSVSAISEWYNMASTCMILAVCFINQYQIGALESIFYFSFNQVDIYCSLKQQSILVACVCVMCQYATCRQIRGNSDRLHYFYNIAIMW